MKLIAKVMSSKEVSVLRGENRVSDNNYISKANKINPNRNWSFLSSEYDEVKNPKRGGHLHGDETITLVIKTLWCGFLKLLRQALKGKHVRGGPAKSGSFLKWGKLWKGISSKEYRLQGWSNIRFSKYGFFEGTKLWTWRYLIKPGLAAGSLFFSRHEERMKLF